MMPVPIATGLSYGMQASTQHAETAVKQALAKAGLSHANSVLLFLTPQYASDPTAAIRAAARAAGCIQVMGSTASGILTEQEWVLDSPGAAAMVFGGDVALTPTQAGRRGEAALSLCTPKGISADWLDMPICRIGAVSSDTVAHGHYAVWGGGRIAADGNVEAGITGARHAVTVSQGIRALTAPIEVAEVQGYEVLRMGNYPALNVLVQSLPPDVGDREQIPFHLLIGGVTFGDPDTAIAEGRYRLNHIIAADPQHGSITLAQALSPGERLFWAMRDALAAERDMRQVIETSYASLGAEPQFGLLFPCTARGPSFFGNRDRDVDQLRQRFPDMPFIGFYGNGEIGPLEEENHLYQFSSILGLFKLE